LIEKNLVLRRSKMATIQTKADLQKAIKAKVKGASPMVKREFYKLLKRADKARLQRIYRSVRVTREGDIRML
jgi:trehalose/maltose hydrolase-like predicted phosphorylase